MNRVAWMVALICVLAPSALALGSDSGARRFVFGRTEPPAVTVSPDDAFSPPASYGFDLGTRPGANHSFFFSVAEGEGSYRVTVTLGDARTAADTTVRAESRQLMLESVATRPGGFVTRSFLVNVRNPRLPPPPRNAPGGTSVLLNEREKGLLRWDDKLTLEFDGPAPVVSAVEIEPVTVPVIYLAGDSTVTDQPAEPGASWGQMLPRFLTGMVVANHAESGETLKSFLSELRLAKILSQIHPGDYLFIQFGHNDEKQNWPQTYADAASTFPAYLRVVIAEVRSRGAFPVLVTPMQRRRFDAAGRIQNTHGAYPQAVREVAAAEHVPVIDLERMSIAFLESLGPDRSALAFPAGGRDITHTNDYGGYELAKCVAQGIRDSVLPLARFLAADFRNFDPAHPDSPESFHLPASAQHSDVTPRGN